MDRNSAAKPARQRAAHMRLTDEHWVLRIYLPGGMITLASTMEPEVEHDEDGKITRIRIAKVDDDTVTDTIEHLEFAAIQAVAWRRHPKQK